MVEMTPGARPFDELTDALQRIAMSPLDNLAERLSTDPEGLLTAVRDLLPTDERVELLLLIDQFEELFTLAADPADSTRFMDALLNAVSAPDSRLMAVNGENGDIQLVRINDGRKYVQLAPSDGLASNAKCFSPDGTLLVVYGENSHLLYVWDLRLVRARLAEKWAWTGICRPTRPRGPTPGRNGWNSSASRET